MDELCRYCEKLVNQSERDVTHSYWKGLPFVCHKACKDAGRKQEAFDCQCIDADCNDCKFFQRGAVVKKLLSAIQDGKPTQKLVNCEIVKGHCLKLNKPTLASPNQWSGLECFEHRRANEYA